MAVRRATGGMPRAARFAAGTRRDRFLYCRDRTGAAVNVAEFVAKWRKVELKERSAAQEHFLDLCRVLGHPTPAEADPTGDTFCFERGASKHGGGEGFADVWPADLPDADILERLLALNLARAAKA